MVTFGLRGRARGFSESRQQESFFKVLSRSALRKKALKAAPSFESFLDCLNNFRTYTA